MQTELVDEIRPERKQSKLHVEVNRVIGDNSGEPIGVGYTIVSTRSGPGKPDKWFINVHPAEMDELISMLEEALAKGKEELSRLGLKEIR